MTGGHILTIHARAVDGGDADDDVRFDVSDDGTAWTPVARLAGGGSLAAEYDIGQRAGPIHVRVVDTDRSLGQHALDSVTVDVLAVVGDGIVLPSPDPASVTAAVVTSRSAAASGAQHGAATVTVLDDRGDPVQGAVVALRFGGVFDESVTGSTAADGTVTLLTAAAARKPAFSTCVLSVTAPLPYAPGAEAC